MLAIIVMAMICYGFCQIAMLALTSSATSITIITLITFLKVCSYSLVITMIGATIVVLSVITMLSCLHHFPTLGQDRNIPVVVSGGLGGKAGIAGP